MKKYFIKVKYSSEKRRYNHTITVYDQNKDGSFNFIGEDDQINTASYRGDEGIASKILHDKFNYKWLKGRENYELQSKSIKLIFLP